MSRRDAIHRAFRPVERIRAQVALRSTDTPQQRAENIVTLMGATTGDPKLIAGHVAVIADVLAQYREIDGVGYDSAVDSYRSWEAAIAAMRAAR